MSGSLQFAFLAGVTTLEVVTFFFLLPVDDATSTASDARELTISLVVALGSMG